MSKLQARDVTLICVAGVQVSKALIALIKSAIRLEFTRVVLVTGKVPSMNLGKFSIEKPLESKLDSLVEYNKYVLYNLSNHVKTSHCLLIQADGYVINGRMWKDEFCKFDYIGAPWPIESDKYVDPFGVHQRVGNGGFSLRSRKLLQVPQNVNVPWEVNEGTFYKHFNQKSYSEDGNICVHNRHIFEREGCKFAPIEVAVLFSRELEISDITFGQTLGFHRYHYKHNFFSSLVKKIKEKYL